MNSVISASSRTIRPSPRHMKKKKFITAAMLGRLKSMIRVTARQCCIDGSDDIIDTIKKWVDQENDRAQQ